VRKAAEARSTRRIDHFRRRGTGARIAGCLVGRRCAFPSPSPRPARWADRELPHSTPERRSVTGRVAAHRRSPGAMPPSGIDARGHGCSDGQDQRTDRQLPCDHDLGGVGRASARWRRHRNADRRKCMGENEPDDESDRSAGESEQEPFPDEEHHYFAAPHPIAIEVPISDVRSSTFMMRVLEMLNTMIMR